MPKEVQIYIPQLETIFLHPSLVKKKIEKLWGNEPFHTLLAKVQNAATSTERKLILHNKNNPFDPATPLLGIYPEDTPLQI